MSIIIIVITASIIIIIIIIVERLAALLVQILILSIKSNYFGLILVLTLYYIVTLFTIDYL